MWGAENNANAAVHARKRARWERGKKKYDIGRRGNSVRINCQVFHIFVFWEPGLTILLEGLNGLVWRIVFVIL